MMKVFIFLFFLFFMGKAYAIPPECRDISDLKDMADIVVQGEVKRIEAKEIRKGVVHTHVDVSVIQYVKGQGSDVLTLKLPGGCAGGMCMEVSGTPKFHVGQKGYLCLKNPEGNAYDEGRFFSPVCGRGMFEKLPE